MTCTLPDTAAAESSNVKPLVAGSAIMKHKKKQKVRLQKPETKCCFYSVSAVIFLQNCKFHHKQSYIQLRIPPNVNCFNTERWKFSCWGKCWHVGLFFGNDLSHEITSTDICLSFKPQSGQHTGSLEIAKNRLEMMS